MSWQELGLEYSSVIHQLCFVLFCGYKVDRLHSSSPLHLSMVTVLIKEMKVQMMYSISEWNIEEQSL